MTPDRRERGTTYTRENLLHTPIHQVDPTEVGSVREMVEAMGQMSFQARGLGMAYQVWENALTDPDRPTIILGVAGSCIAGGLRRVFARLIEHGLVDAMVTVGSQPYQDLYQCRGYDHWRAEPDMDDLQLRELFLDRLYDTLVDEEKFRETDEHLGRLLNKLEPRAHTSREILGFFGEQFDDPDSFVVQAAETGTPMFAPALNDSSIGIGMVHGMLEAREAGDDYPWIDPVKDAYELAQVKYKSEKTCVIYLGGGVPKNYIQQTEVISEILGHDPGGHQYAVQITTDAPYWGALSGCTLEEAQSWGKISKDAVKATAYCDMTIGLPLIATALFQTPEAWEDRERLRFDYDEAGDLALSTR